MRLHDISVPMTCSVPLMLHVTMLHVTIQGNLEDLSLPLGHQQLLAAMYATGKPVVLVLIQGRPLILHGASDAAAAVILAYLPGEYAHTRTHTHVLPDLSSAVAHDPHSHRYV